MHGSTWEYRHRHRHRHRYCLFNLFFTEIKHIQASKQFKVMETPKGQNLTELWGHHFKNNISG